MSRMRQHLHSSSKAGFRHVRVVIDETFNKSACLDLESHLIRWLAGDGHFTVLNGNEGIIDARYYERDLYRENFREIFEQLRGESTNQVDGARIGLAHNIGGPTAVAAVTILGADPG